MSHTLIPSTPSAALSDDMPHPAARVSITTTPGTAATDGAWWPRTTDLALEVPALALAINTLLRTRIARLGYTLDRWAPAPHRLATVGGTTKLGWFEHSRYAGRVTLRLANYAYLVLTVIPPKTDARLAEAMLAEYGGEAPAPEVGIADWDNEGGNAGWDR